MNHQLTQLVNKPTKVTFTNRTLIDVIMTTEPDKIVENDVIFGGIAYHHLVYCVTSYKSNTPTRDTLMQLYFAIAQPHFDYGNVVHDSAAITSKARLQKLQSRAARLISGSSPRQNRNAMFKELE